MHVIAGHDREDDGIELEQGGNVRFDELEGTGSAHLAATGVVMRFRTVEREENAELFTLEVIDNGIVEQRPVGIDGKAQAEILLFADQGFRVLHSPTDRIHAEQRFAAEERDVHETLVQRKRAFESEPDGRFHDFCRHREAAGLVAHLVIAVGAAQVTAFRERKD